MGPTYRGPPTVQPVQLPTGCLITMLRRFHRLMLPISSTSAASCRSSKCSAASAHTSSGTGSPGWGSSVAASVSASAARSASVKYGDSRHAATPKSRSSLSPALRSSAACMSTQTLQPLSWLARTSTSSAVGSGSPTARIARPRSCSAFRASGRSATGWVMRACILDRSFRVLRPPLLVRHCYDGRRREKVTVTDTEWLAQRFEEQRPQLRAVAYRMLGSLSEAEDAVQEGWLRLARSDAAAIDNLGAWLTTVVGRVCLDMLRSRKARREDSLDVRLPDPILTSIDGGLDPEQEAVLAESVGLALLVVLDTLSPAERLPLVLPGTFAGACARA